MKNETEKLERFKKAIFDESAAKAEEIVSAARTECGERVSRARHEADGYVKSVTEQINKECEADAVRELSSGSLSSKRNILLSRESVIDRVFGNVRSRLEEFMKTPEYEKLLVKRLEECAAAYPGEKGCVYISQKDAGLADKLSMGGRFEVKAGGSIGIGGITVVFDESSIAVDCTFDSALEEQRESFAVRAGLSL